ncbi:hypothetical protein [Streptomyces sp. TRM64462]|uniref:SCO2583 family membrane protein n=1 Tax=Streptomyces sp. TRM64462 TaxID=2741726 RepID=UPI001586D1D7|nr:hypothetical protein [Streptomyces sp. TRM64462]
MAGSVDPPDGTPDGTPEGLPGGGEDEYRSVVFDESFVRAAHLQELSAQERLDDHTRPVRDRPHHGGPGPEPPGPGGRRRGSRAGALLLVLVVAMVFAAAVHLGSRQAYPPPLDQRAEPLRMTLLPLVPQGAVPGGRPADLYAHSPAAEYRSGAAGVTLPPVRRTTHFSEGQVMAALSTAKDYLVQSSLDPDVLTGGTVRPVRLLLDPDQLAQFDRSTDAPSTDGRHATAGWLVRFDPARVALADPAVRVHGSLRVAETSPGVLEVTSDHTFVYVVRPAAAPGSDTANASLFTVRRELRFHFDREDLRLHRAELVTSHLQAGPLDCAADLSGALRPLLSGQRATSTTPPPTDPHASDPATATPLCAPLSPAAQPTLPPTTGTPPPQAP